jgi:hypothetical protein
VEIVHILAGPVVAVVITALAFSDDFVIRRKVKDFFSERKVDKDLAEAIETMIAGGIALATFLANVYLFIINLVIALIVFPMEDINIVSAIGGVLTLAILGQTVYIFMKYRILDIGEVCPIGTITYDKFLRWEQVILNSLIAIYFIVGLCLR